MKLRILTVVMVVTSMTAQADPVKSVIVENIVPVPEVTIENTVPVPEVNIQTSVPVPDVTIENTVEVAPGGCSEAPVRFELVGFTTTRIGVVPYSNIPDDSSIVRGGISPQAAAAACQAEFPNSRICQEQEIAQTINWPEISPEADEWAWIASTPKQTPCRLVVVPGSGSHGVVASKQGVVESFAASCATPRSVACCAAVRSW